MIKYFKYIHLHNFTNIKLTVDTYIIHIRINFNVFKCRKFKTLINNNNYNIISYKILVFIINDNMHYIQC